jgi:hypothetical protein
VLTYLSKVAVRNIVSPIGLALASYGVFLIAWIFPPTLYSDIVSEPDIMFLDPQTFLFYTLCVAGFLAGTYCYFYFGLRPVQSGLFEDRRETLGTLYLPIPLLIATALCSVYLIKVAHNINVFTLLASQQGSLIKDAQETGQNDVGSWDAALMMLTSTLCWALYRANQYRLQGFARRVYLICFWIGVLVDVATCIGTVDRTNLMPLVAGLAGVGLFFRTNTKDPRLTRLLVLLVGGFGGAIALFVLLSFLRGALLGTVLLQNVLGYTIVSYNRLAALLTGSMHYAYEHSGVYTIPFLSQSGTLNNIIPFRDYFNWPMAQALWRTEFSSTALAGLSPGYIWSGTFGYLYSDLGWGTPIYMFFYGLIAAYFWRRFERGRLVGLVFYPWILFCILFWIGVNFLLYDRLLHFVQVAILLGAYEYIRGRRTQMKAVSAHGTAVHA